MADADQAPDEQAVSPAVARRDLEREFEAKRREAKQQEKRLRDRLAQDRAEWESYRKQQAQVLADKTEALRRQLESAQRKTESKANAEATLRSVRDSIDVELAAKDAELGKRDKRIADLQMQLARSAPTFAWTGFLIALAGLALLGLSWNETPAGLQWTRLVAAAIVLGGLLLGWRSYRMKQPPS